jgi:predicted lipid-binding transport protein (Tim44 family)
MGGVVRGVLAVSCAFVGSFVVSTFVTSLALGAAFDTTSETAKATSNTWLGLSLLGLWVMLSWLYWRACSARRIFGWMFLTCGLATLALPVGTAMYSAAFVGRQTTPGRGVGAAAGGTVATLGVGLIAFFFGAILLVIAFVLLSGGRTRATMAPFAPQATIATKQCPDCAETVMADARICRFCRHNFGAQATQGWS